MYEITEKKDIALNTFLMYIKAPDIARKAEPGQFLIIIIDEKSERLPLTICDSNPEEGTVMIAVQKIGSTTQKLGELNVGDTLKDVSGPLGRPSDFINIPLEELKKESIIFLAGGLGTAAVYPQVKWMHDHGVDVDVIIAARNKELIILEDEMKKVAKNVYVATDDGSYGFSGLITDCLEDLISNKGKKYTYAIVVGPMIMMKFACLKTKEHNIKTIVSMNTIMVDGSGMCGACRLTVDGKTVFACVDGPEFDGHLIDWNEALRRSRQYCKIEKEGKHFCNLIGGLR